MSDKLPIFSKESASDIAYRSLCGHGGSPAVECSHCGRNHFDMNGENMDPGELEKWEEKQRDNPDKYILHDGYPHFGYLGGKMTVFDCPCGYLAYYESQLWEDRDFIGRYLPTLIKSLFEKAKEEADRLAELEEVSKTS